MCDEESSSSHFFLKTLSLSFKLQVSKARRLLSLCYLKDSKNLKDSKDLKDPKINFKL